VKTVDELRDEFSKALNCKELAVIVAKVELKNEKKKELIDRCWVDFEWESGFIRDIEETKGNQNHIRKQTWLKL
jgi:hypothetical protein